MFIQINQRSDEIMDSGAESDSGSGYSFRRGGRRSQGSRRSSRVRSSGGNNNAAATYNSRHSAAVQGGGNKELSRADSNFSFKSSENSAGRRRWVS